MARQVRPTPEIPDMEILRQIGGGSYGEIWMARSVTGALRAVKVVYRNDFDDDRAFEREFEGILKYEPVARGHPGLVDLLHTGRDRTGAEEFYYYVMELGDDVERGSQILPADYEARTLRGEMLRAGKRPLAVGFCAEVGARLAGALAHLHSNGLAHRDVKPANVIFVDGQACLADIGLVAARDQRTFVGTEGFVPPEGPGSAGADIYALGKVLYEMATGRDRLDFPELPDEPIAKSETKRWLTLNKVICEACDPRLKKRRYTEADEFERVLRLIASKRRLRKRRPPVGLTVVSLFTIGVPFAMQGMARKSLTLRDASFVPNEKPTTSFVTVISDPEGAEIFDEADILLGTTPFGPEEFDLGKTVNFELRYPGHEDKAVSKTLVEGDELIVVNLNRYPPEPGVEWRDSLGQRYLPEPDDSHLSAYLVGPVEFRRSPVAMEEEWKSVEVSENGVRRRVAFVSQEAGRSFADWLAVESEADGVFPDQYRFRAEFKEPGSLRSVPEKAWEGGLRPFHVRVAPVPPGRVVFNTEPPGAFIYINDDYQGTTPLEGLEVKPGETQLRAELEGYENFVTTFQVEEAEEVVLPTAELEATDGMPWQVEDWQNSLGMGFVEISDELQAARWETRVQDYREFTQSTRYPIPEPPQFVQGDNHPVVNIRREDAVAFCEWLTNRERLIGRIRENHYYRLPSDIEWSQLAGVDYEPGTTPRERASLGREGYPWGNELPPNDKVVNIAGQECTGVLPQAMLLEDYNDGFARTSPVGQFPPNDLGLHDLGGNVREWISDYYASGNTDYGTTRGGSWEDYRPEHLRTGARRVVYDTGDGYGFRVMLVRSDPQS
jgi:serine/threonine protein kinase/formylglycine-generating enzyme required for sulfatase activity